MQMYYPNEFKKNFVGVEYNNNLKELLVLEFGKLAGDDVEDKDIDRKERDLLRLDLPNVWNINTSGNMEVEMETEFDMFMLAVGEHTKERVDEITVFRFYALLGYIKEKNKPKK